MRIFGFSVDQVADLSSQIAEALGRMPEITRQHVQECHAILGRLLAESQPGGEPDGSPPANSECGW